MIKVDSADFKSGKIIDFSAAAKKISELKEANKTVGLCHGGFDLLHPGHIKHMESASKLCDYLFVSITSDRFVTSRKGRGRPIFPEKLRAYSVASLEYADYVVISDFELATEIVEKLKPSYYIKGPDFINKTTPGISAERDKIKALDGEIKYTTDKKLSTTDIIRHMQENVMREKMLLGIDRDGTLIEEVEFLGKEKEWKEQIKLRRHVVDLLIYFQTKYDTIMIIVSNQQGIARGYFDKMRVEEINKHIDGLLRNENIVIDNWQYCPDVDRKYAASMRDVEFDPDFVKDKTRRKPSPEMLMYALRELHKNKDDFDRIVVIGNSMDDTDLAKNMNVGFLDVTNKTYADLKNEFDKI